jgi:hypothetical protein
VQSESRVGGDGEDVSMKNSRRLCAHGNENENENENENPSGEEGLNLRIQILGSDGVKHCAKERKTSRIWGQTRRRIKMRPT